MWLLGFRLFKKKVCAGMDAGIDTRRLRNARVAGRHRARRHPGGPPQAAHGRAGACPGAPPAGMARGDAPGRSGVPGRPPADPGCLAGPPATVPAEEGSGAAIGRGRGRRRAPAGGGRQRAAPAAAAAQRILPAQHVEVVRHPPQTQHVLAHPAAGYPGRGGIRPGMRHGDENAVPRGRCPRGRYPRGRYPAAGASAAGGASAGGAAAARRPGRRTLLSAMPPRMAAPPPSWAGPAGLPKTTTPATAPTSGSMLRNAPAISAGSRLWPKANRVNGIRVPPAISATTASRLAVTRRGPTAGARSAR